MEPQGRWQESRASAHKSDVVVGKAAISIKHMNILIQGMFWHVTSSNANGNRFIYQKLNSWTFSLNQNVIFPVVVKRSWL